MKKKELKERISTEFDCSPSEARGVAERAIILKEKIDSDPEGWDGLNIDLEFIISRLDMAPDHISVTGKWNWWAGGLDYFGSPRNYKIE